MKLETKYIIKYAVGFFGALLLLNAALFALPAILLVALFVLVINILRGSLNKSYKNEKDKEE